MLLDTLKYNESKVTRVCLDGNQIDDFFMKQCGEYIRKNRNLESLSLGYNKVTDKGIEILSEYMHGNKTIRYLDIQGNDGITAKSIPYLKTIAESSLIEKIEFNYTSIENQNAIVSLLTFNILRNGSEKIELMEK